MNITSTLLMEMLAAYIWPFTRLASMLMTMLVIGSQSVPIMVRMFYCIVLTAVIAPVLPKMPATDLFSMGGVMITSQQVLIGIAMGLISQMLVQAFMGALQASALHSASLIAIQGSAPYWMRFGFAPAPLTPPLAAKLQTYGQGAQYLRLVRMK